MRGVRAMRVLLIGSLLFVVAASEAAADIYQMRDRFGVLHFTNVPTSGRYKVVLRERPRAGSRHAGVVARSRAERMRAVEPIITEMASRYRVERSLVKAVIKAESDFQPRALSPKGAQGLMQLMPATARRHGVRDVHSPYQNIQGGVRHLRMLLDRYRDNVVLALAAYNAGEGAVDRHRGVPPIAETREYVRRVLTFRQQFLQTASLGAR